LDGPARRTLGRWKRIEGSPLDPAERGDPGRHQRGGRDGCTDRVGEERPHAIELIRLDVEEEEIRPTLGNVDREGRREVRLHGAHDAHDEYAEPEGEDDRYGLVPGAKERRHTLSQWPRRSRRKRSSRRHHPSDRGDPEEHHGDRQRTGEDHALAGGWSLDHARAHHRESEEPDRSRTQKAVRAGARLDGGPEGAERWNLTHGQQRQKPEHHGDPDPDSDPGRDRPRSDLRLHRHREEVREEYR